jgi:hypothetical protein
MTLIPAIFAQNGTLWRHANGEVGVINDTIGQRAVAIVYDTDADHVLALDLLVNGKAIDLVLANSSLSTAKGMRWTWVGRPLTDDTPPLQKMRIE